MIDIGLSKKILSTIADRLNRLLANEYVLYTKTLKCHWNVKGKHFRALHAFFKEQYEELFDIADDIAERVRAFDHDAFGTLEEFSKATILKEEAGKNPPDLKMIEKLLIDHEAIIKQLRNDIEACDRLNDAGTSNLLQEKLMAHEKMAWMLRSHLE